MHGRTRACGYSGLPNMKRFGQVKAVARIPVIANGDIGSPEKAKIRSRYYRCRRADDRPRRAGASLAVPRDRAFPETGTHLMPPRSVKFTRFCSDTLKICISFTAIETGVRVARKHISWYTKGWSGRRLSAT
jgi:tRNA-dihydrouridine synthase B